MQTVRPLTTNTAEQRPTLSNKKWCIPVSSLIKKWEKHGNLIKPFPLHRETDHPGNNKYTISESSYPLTDEETISYDDDDTVYHHHELTEKRLREHNRIVKPMSTHNLLIRAGFF